MQRLVNMYMCSNLNLSVLPILLQYSSIGQIIVSMKIAMSESFFIIPMELIISQDCYVMVCTSLQPVACMVKHCPCSYVSLSSNHRIHVEGFFSYVDSPKVSNISPGSNSLQLVWYKNKTTQCVCPPVEDIISECSCNKNNPENTITIVGRNITITNLTGDDQGHVRLYFMSFTSGCQNRCDVKYITKMYKIQSKLKIISACMPGHVASKFMCPCSF